MSKTLKLDTLKSFKPKGVNVHKSVIDSALKEFEPPKKDPLKTKKTILTPKPSLESKDSSSLDLMKIEYEKKIALLEDKVKIAQSHDKPLLKNEEKILSAIRSEIINQAKEEPIIGRNMLIRKYQMNSKYLDDSIRGLEDRGIIKRKKIPYSSRIMTYSWKLLKSN